MCVGICVLFQDYFGHVSMYSVRTAYCVVLVRSRRVDSRLQSLI